MARRAALFCIAAAAWLCSPAIIDPLPRFTAADDSVGPIVLSAEVRKRFLERFEGVKTSTERVLLLGQIGYLEQEDPELSAYARQRFDEEASTSSSALKQLFEKGNPRLQEKILHLYEERWSILGRGVDGWREEMVRLGLASDFQKVRRAAASLAASRPLPRVTHAVIDAAEIRPELTLAAILTVASDQDFRGLRWALDQAAVRGGVYRDACLFAIYRIGEPARLRLLERLDDDRPEMASLALEGLLLIAGREDLPRLEAWLDRSGAQNPELAERVSRVIAEIEAGIYEPERPNRPELVFE